MSKSHRGKGILDQIKKGRGVCLRCKNENVKILYEHEIDGAKVKVCKFCNASIKNNPPPKPEAPVEETPAVSEEAETESAEA
ncbi:MAG: hypothetical protein R3Y36_00115 [Spirochaetales bacterium]